MSDLSDHITNVGGLHRLALSLGDCTPDDSDNEVGVEFKKRGDRVVITISTKKSGGRTYTMNAALEPDDLLAIAKVMSEP